VLEWMIVFVDPPPPPPHNGGPAPKPDPSPAPGPRDDDGEPKPVKTCLCSPQCTCGCNEGQECECQGSKAAPDWRTHGVVSARLSEGARFTHAGYEVTRDDVMAALQASVPADGKKLRVTVIGAKEDRSRVEADWKTDPNLASVKDGYVFKSYSPD